MRVRLNLKSKRCRMVALLKPVEEVEASRLVGDAGIGGQGESVLKRKCCGGFLFDPYKSIRSAGLDLFLNPHNERERRTGAPFFEFTVACTSDPWCQDSPVTSIRTSTPPWTVKPLMTSFSDF